MAQISLNSSGVASNGTLALQSNGTTTAVTIDASQNVGIGTSSPNNGLVPGLVIGNGTDNKGLTFFGTNTTQQNIAFTDTASTQQGLIQYDHSGDFMRFFTSSLERCRIESSGNLLVGATSQIGTGLLNVKRTSANNTASFQNGSDAGYGIAFYNVAGSVAGSISWTSTTTTYTTSSDYRLKEVISPMTGALDKVALLKPVTYKWKVDGTDGEGFIAHELAEVCPNAITGAKDAVNEDGSIKPQGIDVSFLVATLTAAIQELNAKFEAYKASHP